MKGPSIDPDDLILNEPPADPQEAQAGRAALMDWVDNLTAEQRAQVHAWNVDAVRTAIARGQTSGARLVRAVARAWNDARGLDLEAAR